MASTKPKAGGVPPRPKEAAVVEKPQRERFIEAATDAGVTDEGMEAALRKVAPPKPE